ncbi:MAG: GNAT family N-acetyltransferase [Alphaproteobacteria bacterium]|nr:GNAT family N-acetyltransferase [Alphaproteobacteria bacterium]
MPDGGEKATVKIYRRIEDVDAPGWDACAGIGGPSDNPFLSHAFLKVLEESQSATAQAGWLPQHLVIEDAAGSVIACAPMYVKSHSQGEYVFDHGWADAYQQAGGQYYPKLLVGIPFTPVTGPRLLVQPGSDAERTRKLLIAGMLEVTRQSEMSSLHVTFPIEDEAVALEKAGMVLRMGQQFHWENQGYADFEDFLARLTSRKRKTIRRERSTVAEAGIRVRPLVGAQIEPRHWDAFHRFYIATYDRKWGYPYLTREFFSLLGERLADQVVLIVAEKDGEIIAGALNIRGGDALYGRNWGCAGEFKFLHFEACYYQAIEFAIANGLARVEAGTQGPHKIQRGYRPRPTWSAHWIRDDGFRRAVTDFCRRERRAVEQELAYLAAMSPFRQSEGDVG